MPDLGSELSFSAAKIGCPEQEIGNSGGARADLHFTSAASVSRIAQRRS
jgi:hypothetical protein